MGKTRRRNRGRRKPCPTGLAEECALELSEGGESDVEAAEHVAADATVRGLNGLAAKTGPKTHDIGTTLKSLIDKLQSNIQEDKECACCSLFSLISQSEAVEQILGMNFVRVVGPLLNDRHWPTRHAAVNALRKLSGVGHEVCETMVTQDVLTPLVCLFKKQYPPGWTPQKSVEGKISSSTEAFIEAVYLLLNLCESSSRAVKSFNKECLIEVLIPCLNLDCYGEHIAVAVAYCLQTVTEDNAQAAAFLNEKVNVEIVDSLFSSEGQTSAFILLRVLAAGITLNRNFGKLTDCSPTYLVNLMKFLADTITFETHSLIGVMADRLENGPCESAVNSLQWVLSAQQLALELLINICCSDDESDNWEDMGSSDASDGNPFVDDDMMEHDQLPSQTLLNIPTEVVDAIVSHNLTNLVLSKLNLPSTECMDKLKMTTEGRKIIEQMVKTQSRALLALNNLSSCVDAEELGGQNNLFTVWMDIGKLLFQNQKLDLEMVEAATKALGAIVQKLAEAKSKHFEEFPLEDLNKFFEVVNNVEEAQVKANVIRIVGNIGCLMGKSVDRCAVQLKAIGVFLLDVCNREDKVWLSCEALDAILDVFGDDDLDPVMQEIGMLEKLKSFLPQLKHKISLQRRDLDIHLPVVATAKTNLVRFIRYKTNQAIN